MLLGIITHWVLSATGAVLFVLGLAGWVGQLMPGVGHFHEPFVPPQQRARPILAAPGPVEQLKPDRPGYRFRIPEKIHPISAGVKGGVVGGLVMPIPAIAWGILSGNGPWLPINLLAGMMLPGIEGTDQEKLQQFSPLLFLVALFIHAILSTGIGSMYGVILPTVPQFPGSQLLFGGLIFPLLWSGICYGLLGTVNPAFEEYVDWRFFIVSQMFYGIAAAVVVEASEKVYIAPAGGGA
ncbi:MAG: hypothetical protein U0797_28940 [Gemmataceae bacterium]